MYIGKRPVFILGCAITFLTAIWAGASSSFNSLQAACVVSGFGGGASEALGAAIINVSVLHRTTPVATADQKYSGPLLLARERVKDGLVHDFTSIWKQSGAFVRWIYHREYVKLYSFLISGFFTDT